MQRACPESPEFPILGNPTYSPAAGKAMELLMWCNLGLRTLGNELRHRGFFLHAQELLQLGWEVSDVPQSVSLSTC